MEREGLIKWAESERRHSGIRFTRWYYLKLRMRNAWYRLKRRFRPEPPGAPCYMTCETLIAWNPAIEVRMANIYG